MLCQIGVASTRWGEVVQVKKMVDKVMPAEILDAPWEGEAGGPRSTREVLIEGYLQHYEDLFTFHNLDVCAAQASLPYPIV